MGTREREYAAPKQHYTAVVEVMHVTPDQTVTNSYSDTKAVAKEKREVARIVVRAESLEKLIEKVNAHTALIEDI